MIYFDNAATTKVSDKVLKAMLPYFTEKYGNASSLHSFGREASEAIARSRRTVADFLGASPEEIIFTSGSTESNNLAIKGLVEASQSRLDDRKKTHLIVSSIEHHCVYDSSKYEGDLGNSEVTWLSVDNKGLVDPADLEEAVRDNTVLVSVMYVNNEVGAVEPIAEIGRLIKKINSARSASNKSRIYFHTDAVQAISYLDCHVDHLGVDLLSSSAHKFHGPKGVGFLYLRRGTPLIRLQHGGSQERNLRAGTSNVPGIVGLAAALEEVLHKRDERVSYVTRLRDRLIDGTLCIPGVVLSGPEPGPKRAPHIASFLVSGVDGEALLLRLNKEGVAVSSGSACTSASLDPSHVLLAMGVGEAESHGSIRVSLSSYNTEGEVDTFVKVFAAVIEDVRKIAPDLL